MVLAGINGVMSVFSTGVSAGFGGGTCGCGCVEPGRRGNGGRDPGNGHTSEQSTGKCTLRSQTGSGNYPKRQSGAHG